MKKLTILLLFLWAGLAWGQGPLSGANGDCTIGGQQVIVNGLASQGSQPIGTTTVSIGSGVLASYPNCSVTVFFTGTTNKANLFANNPSSSPTPLSNPFTANNDGSWLFFVAPACYDITIGTGTGPTMPTSRTYTDVCFAGIGAGTVQSFSADATVGSLFSTTVSAATTNPFLHFSLLPAPGYYVFGNSQATPSPGQYVAITTRMLPFTYTGNTTLLATSLPLSNVAGTEICEDGLGNLKDSGCSNASAGVTSFNTRTGAVTSQTGDYSVAQVTGAAPLASPNFSGTPTTPTPAAGDTSTQVTNDSWVSTYFAVLASPAFTGVPTAPTAALNTNTTQLATTAFVISQIAGGGFAPLNSPAFTGTPTAPTAAVNTNTTQLATTAFVIGQASTTTPIVDGTPAIGTSLTYARADHVHPTDNSRAPVNNPNFTGNVGLGTGELLDSANSPGTPGQFLKSTGSTTLWSTVTGSGTVTSVDGSASEGAETVVSGSVAAITGAGTIRATIKWVTVTGAQTPLDTNRGQAWLSNDVGNDVYTLSTPSGSNFQNGWYLWIKNGSTTGTITLTPAGSTTIDGAATLVVQTHSVILFESDGTNYHSLAFSPVGNNATNLVYASPCSSSGTPQMRALCTADIPALSFPLTVAGTVNSGGVIYASSSTQLSSSAVLPTGDFVLGGGAGGAPTATFSAVPIANGGLNVTSAAAGQVPNTTSSTVAPWTAAPVLGVGGTSTGSTIWRSSTNALAGIEVAEGATPTIETLGTGEAFSVVATGILTLQAGTNVVIEPASGDAVEISIAGAGGTAAAPALVSALSVTTGLWWPTSTTLAFSSGGVETVVLSGVGVKIGGSEVFNMASTIGAASDVGVSRINTNIAGIGRGTSGQTTGGLELSYVQSAGTKFTASGCTNSTLVGGATVGSFKTGASGACTITITMGDTDTATNGWACYASDQTTAAGNPIYQSGGSTTTAVLVSTASTGSGDVISFGCVAY